MNIDGQSSFKVDPTKCDIFSLGITFLELLGIDNIRKFLNIGKTDQVLTAEYLIQNALPYVPLTSIKFKPKSKQEIHKFKKNTQVIDNANKEFRKRLG